MRLGAPWCTRVAKRTTTVNTFVPRLSYATGNSGVPASIPLLPLGVGSLMKPQGPTKIHLVKKTAAGKRNSSRWLGRHFASGKRIPESGIYRVSHTQHRLPHAVTLLKGEHFPVCLQCQEAVHFELL